MSIEILAPGGSVEGIYAALLHGADAVYTGTSRFSARAFADNPTVPQLCEILEYAHARKKKIYLTVNTLLTEEELEEDLYPMLKPLYENGLDAVIVQDPGVMHLIHECFPDMDIHASTQMTILTAQGANQWIPYGVTRVVPARELTIKEIAQMRRETSLEMEVFVHGALCYCYSGQCLMSQVIGGRSGNRGMCAQPCRFPYQTSNGETGHFLSPKDMCTLGQIGELIEAGVDSLKIEGRMKKPEYAAFTAKMYRLYADAFETGKTISHVELQEDIRKLMDLYNRGGFCKGYLFEKDKKDIIFKDKNGHYGVEVGEVTHVQKGQVTYRLSNSIAYQDVLEFRDKNGEKQYEYTVKDGAEPPAEISARYQKGCVIKPGQKVFRTKNSMLLEEINEEILQEKKEDKCKVKGFFKAEVGKEIVLEITCGNLRCQCTGVVAQEAKGKPVLAADIEKRLKKTGESEYEFSQIELSVPEGIFIPLGKIAALRREAFEKMKQLQKDADLEKRRKVPACPPTSLPEKKNEKKEQVFVNLTDFRHISEVKSLVKEGKIKVTMVIPLEWFPAAKWAEVSEMMKDMPFYISLPVILDMPARKHFLHNWEKYGVCFQKGNVEGILIQSMEHIPVLSGMGMADLPRVAGPRLYQWNQRTKRVYESFGIKGHASLRYGRQAVMVTKGCVNQQLGQCKKEGKNPVIQEISTPKKDCFLSLPICEYCYTFCYEKDAKRYELQCEDDVPLVDLALMSSQEIRKVLTQWNSLL